MPIAPAGYNDYRLMSHGIFPPMHLNAFSTFNMTLFAVRCGYHMISLETPGKLDVDCAVRYRHKNDATEPVFKALADHDQDTLAMIQALVARLRASSTLLVVLQRPTQGLDSQKFPD
jgi:2-polyprenyl-6-hydroxyphenyl methylase / 3-demethylubiquinone-9 3-methyltransferase